MTMVEARRPIAIGQKPADRAYGFPHSAGCAFIVAKPTNVPIDQLHVRDRSIHAQWESYMRKNQPVDMTAARLRAQTFASANYSTSSMSTTKWRTLFRAIERSAVEVKGMTVKFIGEDKEWSAIHPGLHPPYAYIALWPLDVYPLVEIEWVEFRRIVERQRLNNVPAELVAQDIDAILTAIESTGKRFPLEFSEEALRVVGHVK